MHTTKTTMRLPWSASINCITHENDNIQAGNWQHECAGALKHQTKLLWVTCTLQTPWLQTTPCISHNSIADQHNNPHTTQVNLHTTRMHNRPGTLQNRMTTMQHAANQSMKTSATFTNHTTLAPPVLIHGHNQGHTHHHTTADPKHKTQCFTPAPHTTRTSQITCWLRGDVLEHLDNTYNCTGSLAI